MIINKLILKTSLLLGLSVLFCCQSDTSRKQVKDTTYINPASLLDNRCIATLTNEQEIIVQRILTYIKEQVASKNFCKLPYHPGGVCNKTIEIDTNTCEFIFDDLTKYFSTHKKLSFCVSDSFGKDWLAATDVKYSDSHIYLAKEFFIIPEEERQRTIIHELHHLQGNHLQHSYPKNCEYYKNWSLVAEYCLTCQATILPPSLSTCSNKEEGIFIINRKL